MSLTLKESCSKYERYARRNKSLLTFKEFNAKFFTCLPSSKEVESKFASSVRKAYRSQGLPITSRLMSLYKALSKDTDIETPTVISAVPKPAGKSFTVNVPHTYEGAMRNNIRAPECTETKKVVVSEKEEEMVAWDLEEYIAAVLDSPLKEDKGLMVHLVPEFRGVALSSLACKLTKSAWDVFREREGHVLKMKDGSAFDVRNVELNAADVKKFVKNRKKKVEGPYFIRFSSI